MRPETRQTYTLVYDGTCKLCGRVVNLLRSWDRQGLLEITPYQAPGVQARFSWIREQAFTEAVQLIGPGGKTWEAEGAVEQLLDVLPKGEWIAWVFGVPFMRPLAAKAYRWVARNRYRLGCGEHCGK